MISYFLKRFYRSFFAFFGTIIALLALGDLLVRVALLPSLRSIPIIVFIMFPFMSLFATPLATSLSVQTTLGKLLDNNEMLLFYYLPALRKKLYAALFLFSSIFMIFYVPLVFEWAPQSYFMGKRFMVVLAKERINQLQPNVFHSFFSKFFIFFKKKEWVYDEKLEEWQSQFNGLIVVTQQDARKVIITAQHAYFKDHAFFLYDGMVYSFDESARYTVTFKESCIYLERLWKHYLDLEISSKDPKYMSFQELWQEQNHDNAPAVIEFHSRVIRVVWQSLFPFLCYWIIITWGIVGGNNLLLSMTSSLLCMFFSYLNIGLAPLFKNHVIGALVVLYGLLLAIVMIIILLYKKRNV